MNTEAALSDTDSFIEEVTEEVRRDKLFAALRKYGWIGITAVILLVGGAAYNEWRKASERSAAQDLGDAILQATASTDVTARPALLSKIAPSKNSAKVFLGMFEAASLAEAKDKPAALEILDKIAANTDAPKIYQQLALLKAVILRGSDQDKAERLATLKVLSAAGNPFRVLALEQTALAYIDYGNNDKAIEVLRTILDEPGATQGLLQRAQQLIVALGGTISNG